jgi:hypothetical protein
MKLEDIHTNWEADSKIDTTELGQASINIPYLHAKYMKILSEERTRFHQRNFEYKQMLKTKWEYYNGLLDLEQLKERGWEPFSQRVLKTDLDKYLEADSDLNVAKGKVTIQEEKVKVLEEIVRNLNGRGFQIKNAIDWYKFTNGQV